MVKNPDATRHFYQGDQLHTALSDASSHTVFRTSDMALSESHVEGGHTAARLLAADKNGSVMNMKYNSEALPLAYSTYGHLAAEHGSLTMLAFNGEQRDRKTGCYLLGNGYRPYNPKLMRFHSADSLSPFGAGGMNAFSYCAGDPVNRTDPTGHMYYQGTSRSYPGLQNMVKLKDPAAGMKLVSLPPPEVPKPIARPSHNWRKIAEKQGWLLHDDKKRLVEINNFVASRKLGHGSNAPEKLKTDVASFINKRITNPDEPIPSAIISKPAKEAANKLGRYLIKSLEIEQTDEINRIRT
ncbi:hypothetical protein PS627_03843 [Pseudomonas fluorescens]|uniref:RHS repeat-associated core domain-containing protein n=1 Tax=Pseudomonas fluorescens TaxID=294 RepID=UPI0012599C7D|nr:RHS repeat-associated core domain-containing protein [Pseudomonas fluorescens]CAG8870087.1 hypothetical protein PS627_03843 [Pseudomonas fluorescens]